MNFVTAILGFCAATTAHAQWIHEVVKDPMTDEQAYVQLTARSANSLALQPPYDGPNYATLIQRIGKIPGGMSLVLSVDKGQFVCPLSGCKVRIKMGSKQPTTVTAIPSPDGSPNVLVMKEMADPLADQILVEAMVYQAGPQLFTFAVPGGLAGAKKIAKGQ